MPVSGSWMAFPRGRFEPTDDQFDWDYIKEVLDREGTRGRHLILRLVVDWDELEPIEENYKGPPWLLQRVGEHRGLSIPEDPSSREKRATKYDHPDFIVEAIEAIQALSGYLKEDPRAFILQAGLIGYWSEWHTFPREDWNANPTTKQAILDAYLKNLPSNCFTQLRYPNEPDIKAQRRIGYFNDSATLTEYGTSFGKIIEQRKLWKYGPITGSWPPNVEPEYWQRFFLSHEGEQFIKHGRYSTLAIPETKDIKRQLAGWTPDDVFMTMHRRLGYNLQVGQICHLINKAGVLNVELTLENNGIARFYCDWKTEIAIFDAESSELVDLIAAEIDLRKLAPGSSTVFNVASSRKLDSNRSYHVGLRVIQPGAETVKTQRWPLDARNAYVVLANDLQVIQGYWNADHTLGGGWNLLGKVELRSSVARPLDETSFPFQGSARPAVSPR